MIDLRKAFAGRHERHPLYSVEAAAGVIALLPGDDLLRRLDEIGGWLRSVAESPDFKPAIRYEVTGLLDDAGRSAERALLLRYFKDPRPRNAPARLAWNTVHTYWLGLAQAYERCALEQLPASKAVGVAAGELAAVAARALRARVSEMRIAALRYAPSDAAAWRGLGSVFARCERAGIAGTAARAYSAERYHTTPLLELMNQLLVAVAAPERLPPEEIEAAYRIGRRFAGAGRFEARSFEGATHFIDLDGSAPPGRVGGAAPPAGPGVRFFGAPKALANLKHMIENQELSLLDEDLRLAQEYSPGQKVTVIRRFMQYWSASPPAPERSFVKLEGGLSVVHGFHDLCRQLPHAATRGAAELAEEEAPAPPEVWSEHDAGLHLLHAECSSGIGEWAEVGRLVALRLGGRAEWLLAVVRRLTGEQALHAEFEVLSRKAFSAWLRILGPEGRMAANWENASGSFSYQHVEVIVLPDARSAAGLPTLVLPKGSFIPRQVAELLHGGASRALKFTEFFEQGKDYDWCAFEWGKPQADQERSVAPE